MSWPTDLGGSGSTHWAYPDNKYLRLPSLSTTQYEYYGLYQSGQSTNESGVDYRIKVDKQTNTWEDVVTGSTAPYPTTLTESTVSGVVYVTLAGGGYTLFTFAKPIVSGGTSTEGSTAPSGSSYINSQGQIVFVITASSPSSDGNVVYKIYRRPIGSAFEQAYVVPHTSGTTADPDDTEFTIGLNYSLYDLWELRVESSTALVQSGILASYSTMKRVFSNFW